jgi:cytoskeletal protein CcmA (bactofilin family)
MFKSGESSGSFNGFLDAGSHIKGELQFEDEFRVDGKVTGKVTSKGDLILGEGGEVDGEVVVGRVFVSGTLRGSVDASRQIEISPGGRVFADVNTPSLVIQDGAIFEGSCSMKKAPAATASQEPTRAASLKIGAAKTAPQKA